jgi:hypothetical protein
MSAGAADDVRESDLKRHAMRSLSTAAAIAVVLTSSARAQAPAPAAPQPGAMVTVEGCVTRESATQSSAPAQYVLTDDSRPVPAPPGRAPATSSGATSSGPPQPKRPMYVLRTQADKIDLAAHLNQRVRVTGATTAPMTTAPLAGRSPEATPNPAPTGPPGSTGTPFDTANLPTLAVTTLVKLDGTCR